jgi:ADP-heptose:LPS heptosyltransferase
MAPYLNRSTIRRFRKDYDHLEQELLTALELDPVSPDVHYALGVNALKQEQYERAFAEIEWYWHKNLLTSTRMPTSMPRWYGEDITGKSIMIYADQGVGDILMMLRYVPIIAEQYKPAKMIINTNAKMHDIVTNSFPELFANGQAEIYKNVISAKDAPIDYIIAVMTIPHVLGTAIDTIPATQGYLKKRDALNYKTDKDFVIGISWHTKSLDAGFIRSLKLMDFSFLAKYNNVRVLDLQYGDTAAERTDAKAKGFDIHHDDTIDTWAELQPLLDQIASCDLVISIDNTTVHAAGAIGKPCWTILPQESYWRWPIAGESTPWYDSLRIFRQKEGESYESLFATIEAEFKKFLDGDASTLTPPKFKRLFPETPKPEKTALLINDTNACYTWGNFASMEGIKNSLTHQGYTVESISTLGLDWFTPKNPSLQDFDDPKYLAACRYRNPTLFWQMEKADAVIINGEGMLNELTDSALNMLYLAYVAKHFYKRKVTIINHSCFPEGGPNLTDPQNLAFYHKVYTTIDGCVAREQVTYDLLKSIGAKNVQLGLDASILWLKKYQETAPQVTKTKTAIITAGPGYGSNYAETFAHLCKKLRANGLKPILLHGAKWHTSQEDNMLAEDLKELYPDITIIKARTADEFMEHLSAAQMVFSGFLPISLMAHALGCQSVPFTTGSNGLSMIGMAKNCGIPAPLFYEDPNIEKKLEAAIKNTRFPSESIDKLTSLAQKNISFL